MGVTGLLPCLRSITHPVPLERYTGLTVAVDAMSWLHKGLISCDVRSLAKSQWNDKLLRERNEEQRPIISGNASNPETVRKRLNFDRFVKDTIKPARTEMNPDITPISKCVTYTIRHAMTLRDVYRMDVILVIDGDSPPAKSRIDANRAKNRRTAYTEALAAENSKVGVAKKTRSLFARACSVTQEMKLELIQACRESNLNFIVAPYEADAQMARMASGGLVDVIVSEDSDLLAYGCPRVLFKIDLEAGRGEEIQLMRDLAAVEELSFKSWNHDMFVYMCILAGCDYCEGVRGVGIKMAHKIVRMNRTPGKILKSLRKMGRLDCDGDSEEEPFEDRFWMAYRTFRHQRVYCLETCRVDTLMPININIGQEDDGNVDMKKTRDMWPYLGKWMEDDLAQGVANGQLHPKHKIPWEACQHHQSLSTSSITSHSEIIDATPTKTKNDFKSLFSFFTSKSNKQTNVNTDTKEETTTPTLPNVSVNTTKQLTNILNKSCKGFRKRSSTGGDVRIAPIRFKCYASDLVGNSFQTLSQRNRKFPAAVTIISNQATGHLKKRRKSDGTDLNTTQRTDRPAIDLSDVIVSDRDEGNVSDDVANKIRRSRHFTSGDSDEPIRNSDISRAVPSKRGQSLPNTVTGHRIQLDKGGHDREEYFDRSRNLSGVDSGLAGHVRYIDDIRRRSNGTDLNSTQRTDRLGVDRSDVMVSDCDVGNASDDVASNIRRSRHFTTGNCDEPIRNSDISRAIHSRRRHSLTDTVTTQQIQIDEGGHDGEEYFDPSQNLLGVDSDRGGHVRCVDDISRILPQHTIDDNITCPSIATIWDGYKDNSVLRKYGHERNDSNGVFYCGYSEKETRNETNKDRVSGNFEGERQAVSFSTRIEHTQYCNDRCDPISFNPLLGIEKDRTNHATGGKRSVSIQNNMPNTMFASSHSDYRTNKYNTEESVHEDNLLTAMDGFLGL